MKRALMLALSAAALFAPAAAQARTDDMAKPIVFLAGGDELSCSAFAPMQAAFEKFTTTVAGAKVQLAGTMRTVGVNGSSGCTATLPSSGGASIEQLGDQFATWVVGQYDDKTIDVVAFGRGGLILRSALAQRPKLRVEDAVTIGTPHAGSTLHRNPQGDGGTDWSVIASAADAVVPVASAIDMDAAHKTIYAKVTREQLLTDASTKRNLAIQYSHDGLEFQPSTGAPHPIQRVGEDLVFGSDGGGGGCAFAATQPHECGVTPIIMLPGFGASELVCDEGGSTTNLWPGAISWGPKFRTMALNAQGTGPEVSTECTTSIRPTGNALECVLACAKDIHADSVEWLKRIGGPHTYVFGWDFRKGPDKTLKRLDAFIDKVRRDHAASKVAIVSHSYGGLLTRWYVDDPDRAQKIARVANFGSPYWGAPKAWFAVAYGYETPTWEMSDNIVDNDNFLHWTRNLTGMYYLFPGQAWFDHIPGKGSAWLEVNEAPMRNTTQAAWAIGQAGGNEALAKTVAAGHKDHIDGFKTYGGAIDWRIFVGSEKPTMGHVRAYTDDTDPQFSWINGDGTVPLVSQRQSFRAGDRQMGDQVKTYNFCDVSHMGEMEDEDIQDAVTPFITTGANPIVDGETLRDDPCPLDTSEYEFEGDEDQKSISISEGIEGVKASRAPSQTPAATGPMSLDDAELAGLVDVVRVPGALRFVTTTRKPLTVRAAGTGTVTVTPITGDGKEGKARVYDLGATPIAIAADGAETRSAAPSRAADTRAPRTTAVIKRGKLRVKAKDASGIKVTLVQVGKRTPQIYKRPLRVGAKAKVRVWSVDTAGNTERKRLVKR